MNTGGFAGLHTDPKACLRHTGTTTDDVVHADPRLVPVARAGSSSNERWLSAIQGSACRARATLSLEPG